MERALYTNTCQNSHSIASSKEAVARKAALCIGVLEAVDDDILARVVVKSASLGSEAIIEFMHALTTVSLEELSGKPTPRVFALSKIVEACHHNMMRPRIVWTILWKGSNEALQHNDGWHGLSEYFVDIGCHENLQVAMYAMDALRQVLNIAP